MKIFNANIFSILKLCQAVCQIVFVCFSALYNLVFLEHFFVVKKRIFSRKSENQKRWFLKKTYIFWLIRFFITQMQRYSLNASTYNHETFEEPANTSNANNQQETVKQELFLFKPKKTYIFKKKRIYVFYFWCQRGDINGIGGLLPKFKKHFPSFAPRWALQNGESKSMRNSGSKGLIWFDVQMSVW